MLAFKTLFRQMRTELEHDLRQEGLGAPAGGAPAAASTEVMARSLSTSGAKVAFAVACARGPTISFPQRASKHGFIAVR